MNHLQDFMAECNRQTRTPDASGKALSQEEFGVNGSRYWGTFGAAQMLPVMTRHGYEDQLVIPLVSAAEQYASPPLSHQKLTRYSNNAEYFIQMVDGKSSPVVFTYILTDREL